MITVSTVANATKGELLCITYELFLEKVKLAQQSTEEESEKAVQRAIDIIQMLAGDLDFNIEISKELFRVYVYVQGLLIQSKASRAKAMKLEEAYGLMEKIYLGFKEAVKKEEVGGPSIQNAEVIYAGMTYGKSSLNEISTQDTQRGFKA